MTERQLGIEAFREGRFRAAVARLRTAAADPERTVSQASAFQTYAFLGAALYALGDASGAAEAFSTAVTLHTGGTPPLDLMINLANAYLASGKRVEAEQALERALRDSPGSMEARLLLDRLRSRAESLPLTGSILGESPQSVKRFMDTLSFSGASQGYSPEEVRTALTQIRHYIDSLSAQLSDKDRTLFDQSAEIERLRQSEETLIGNMVQARQDTDRLRNSGPSRAAPVPADNGTDNGQGADGGPDGSDLTPLEKLFQRKS